MSDGLCKDLLHCEGDHDEEDAMTFVWQLQILCTSQPCRFNQDSRQDVEAKTVLLEDAANSCTHALKADGLVGLKFNVPPSLQRQTQQQCSSSAWKQQPAAHSSVQNPSVVVCVFGEEGGREHQHKWNQGQGEASKPGRVRVRAKAKVKQVSLVGGKG